MQIVLVGGFAGIEKKNVLLSIGNELAARGKKVGVVLIEGVENNEKGSIDLDPSIIVREMMNIPCTFATDLVAELSGIDEQSAFGYLLIEVPLGLSPGKVKKALKTPEFKYLSFAPLIYVFDMNILKCDAKMIPRLVSTQIRESEVVFANTGSTGQKDLALLNSIFEEMNPDAKIFGCTAGPEGHTICDLVNMITN